MSAASHVAKEPTGLPPGKDPEGQENRDPVPIGVLIRAFCGQPDQFIASTFPEPPEAA